MESVESKKRLLRTSHRYAATTMTTTTAPAPDFVATTPSINNNVQQNMVKDDGGDGYDDMPSRITPVNGSSDSDDIEFQSRGINIVDTNAKNFSNVTPEEVSDYYKSLGEWQNVLPKTDYTYSPMSQFYTKKINGNIPIIPNMSRRNIWKMSVNGELQQNEMNTYLAKNYEYDERRRLQREKESMSRIRVLRQITHVTRTIVRTVVRRVYVNTVRTYSSMTSNSSSRSSSGGNFLFNCMLLALLALLAYLLLPKTIDSYTLWNPFVNLFLSCRNLVFYLYDLTWSSTTFLMSLISSCMSNGAQAANTFVFAPIFRLLVLLVSSDYRPKSNSVRSDSSAPPDSLDIDSVIRKWFDENLDNIAKKMVDSNDFVNFINERFRNHEQTQQTKFENFLQSYNFDNTRIGEKFKNLEQKVSQWRSEDSQLLEQRIREVKEQIKLNENLVQREIVVVLASLVGSKSSDDDLRRKFASIFDLLEDASIKINKLTADFDIYSKNATENPQANDRLREELLYNLKATVEDMVAKRLQEWRQTVTVDRTVKSEKIDLAENYVTEAIRKALEIYDADKTGKPDFALESQGGIILSTRCTETKTANAQFSIFGIPLWHATRSPRTVIQPGVHPGECWAFPGSTGYLVIQLSERIIITGFTIEHIPRSLSANGVIDSAPKDFSVWALQWESDPEPKFLGQFRFDDFGYSVQYFEAVRLAEPYQIVELKILSNHGKMDYTCLYRFRVHGIPA
ncbi:uncharacterized protein LOC135834734 isoform X2 [Planococcus citri]|uniref:uncharacterized protein LOC135834734 isoform X2 n=1 Tax=Planococcus citri TaxID=170843 RepID=UPI0031F7D324